MAMCMCVFFLFFVFLLFCYFFFFFCWELRVPNLAKNWPIPPSETHPFFGPELASLLKFVPNNLGEKKHTQFDISFDNIQV